MKSPLHPNRSGDRQIARLLLAALGAAGHEVTLASRFRSRDGGGDETRQARLADIGERLAERLLRRYRSGPAAARPELWFTYHVYHKAPDWLGPPLAKTLDIPYVVAEASFAPKQADGPWRMGHDAAGKAIAAAQAVFNLNPGDAACVQAVLSDPRRLVALKPFVDVGEYAAGATRSATRQVLARRLRLPAGDTWLLAVAMMRIGNKEDSYRLLAEALAMLEARPWRLIIVGDGPLRAEVEALFARFAPGRVVFTGALGGPDVRALLAHSDLFVWPGVREPIGMAMLEAQAAGLPVVSGDNPGIAAIVRDGCSGRLVARGDAPAFAAAVADLLDAPEQRAAMGAHARRQALANHDIAGAASTLDAVLCGLQAGTWP